MAELDTRYPAYGFAEHKGYVNAAHNAAIEAHGPCPEHRFSYINVARRAGSDRRVPVRTLVRVGAGDNDGVEAAEWAEIDRTDAGMVDAGLVGTGMVDDELVETGEGES